MSNFKTSTKKDLETFILDNNFKKIFILAGNQSFHLSGLKEFFSRGFNNKELKFYFKKANFPEYFELIDIISKIKNFSPDLIIAAGGGSVLDYAKIANVIDYEDDLANKIVNSTCKINTPKAKLLAIPTTAGSGAEVTSNAVIYVNKTKYSIEGEKIKPDFFFLISDFIKGASNKIKSSAGFDAIAQSIESLVSKKSNKESVKYATKSLSISLDYFLKFLRSPNEENTCAMAFAANLSGKAINISKTTAPHAVSYPFTSSFNISHGHAVSLTLNQFMKYNYKNQHHAECDFNLRDRFDLLFDATKTKSIEEFLKYIDDLKRNAGLESDYTKLGIDMDKFIPRLLQETNDQRLKNNPVKITKESIKLILLNE